MWRRKHKMPRRVDERTFAYGIISPEQEHKSLSPGREMRNHRVGEPFPTVPLMRACAVSLDCERGVEQQHALTRPALKIARGRKRRPRVGAYFFEDIDQRRRHSHPVGNRETQSVGLSRIMIRILTENHHLHLVERTGVESSENVACRRKHHVRGILLAHERGERCEIRLIKFIGKHLLP